MGPKFTNFFDINTKNYNGAMMIIIVWQDQDPVVINH